MEKTKEIIGTILAPIVKIDKARCLKLINLIYKELKMLYYTNPDFIEDVFSTVLGGFSNVKSSFSKNKIELELAGVKKENIELNYDDKYFTVKWKDKQGSEHTKTYMFTESINEDDVKASYVDGLLVVDFKSKEKKTNKGSIKL